MSRSEIRDLLSRLTTREADEAWEEFLERYSPLIYKIGSRFEHDEDRIRDCFLHVCQKLSEGRSRRLRQYRPSEPTSFEGWLSVVVRNLCIDWLRQRLGRRRVFRSVERLPALDQEVFRCVFHDHLSIRATWFRLSADYPGLTEGRVESVLDGLHRRLGKTHLWLLSGGAGRGSDAAVDAEQVASSLPSPEQVAGAKEAAKALAETVAALEPEERLLLQLRFEQDLTLEQVARTLKLNTAGAADRRIRNVLAKLRSRLTAPGDGPERKGATVSVEADEKSGVLRDER